MASHRRSVQGDLFNCNVSGNPNKHGDDIQFLPFMVGPGRHSFSSVDCEFPSSGLTILLSFPGVIQYIRSNTNTQHQPDTTKRNNYGLGNGSSMQDTMRLDYSQVAGALELVTRHNHPLQELRCHQIFTLCREWLRNLQVKGCNL